MSERECSAVAGAEALARPEGTLGLPPLHSAGLARFARAVLRFLWDGCDLDGGDIQHLALKHGLIGRTRFDPAKHSDHLGVGAVPGDEWFVEQPWLKRLARSSETQSPQSAEGVPSAFAQDEPLPSSPLPDLLREVVRAATAVSEDASPNSDRALQMKGDAVVNGNLILNLRSALSKAQEIMGDD